ncbi:unnamed protein product [Mytilus coruscus]|uniref:Tyr recombinase domain-containing protein n=1 Tax=Mytilus coruscus TaxID=42192 RepID=A0A6J8BBS4_MYTCO|nr:unnamed protein product [Mytilus coruscus]
MDAEYTVGKKLGKTNFKIGKKSHDDKKTFKKPYVHVPKRHFDKPSNKKDFLGKPTYKKKKFKKKAPRAGQEVPIKLPKQNSLPHGRKSVNTSMFKTHSTRGASTSAALKAGVSVNSILKSAGWTNESTFRQFYNRPVTVQEYNDNYSVRVLRGK